MKLFQCSTALTAIAACSFSGLFIGSAKAKPPELLSEVGQAIFESPIGVRLGADSSRRCFLAVQALIDGEFPSAPDSLRGFLEQVCYQGLRSELEREGILGLLQTLGVEPEARTFGNDTEEQAILASLIYPCWNVGTISREAQSITLRVSFGVDGFRQPEAGSIALMEASEGPDYAVAQAFEAARRAIIRCAANGFPDTLPAGEYQLGFPLSP